MITQIIFILFAFTPMTCRPNEEKMFVKKLESIVFHGNAGS